MHTNFYVTRIMYLAYILIQNIHAFCLYRQTIQTQMYIEMKFVPQYESFGTRSIWIFKAIKA